VAANDRLAVSLTKQAINRSLDVAGMRQALLQALELDVIIETTETAESREFNEILKREGAKAAIAWRASRAAGAPSGEG
jgi:enoyl-CoA hydratase